MPTNTNTHTTLPDIDKLLESQRLCTELAYNCDKCPYGDEHCDDQQKDILTALEAAKDYLKHFDTTHTPKLLRLLYELSARLETLWGIEKDEMIANQLETCFDNVNELIDGFLS